MRPRLSTYQNVYDCCFNKLYFQLTQDVMSTDEITGMISHKCLLNHISLLGIITYALILFFDTVPGREGSGKFPKKLLGTYYF